MALPGDGASDAPKVFISYSHDSPEHARQVAALAQRLNRDHIDTVIDQYVNGSPDEGWERWMMDHLDWANFVLVVCSSTYYRRFRGHPTEGAGKGVDWEGALITSEIYQSRSSLSKFVPIFLGSADEESIPNPMRSSKYYVLQSEEVYESLLRFFHGLAGIEREPPGESRTYGPNRVEPMSFAPNVDERRLRIYTERLRERVERVRGVLSFVSIGVNTEAAPTDGFDMLLTADGTTAKASTVEDLLQTTRAIKLIGDPGSGKSTQTRALVHRLLLDFDPRKRSGTLPILIELSGVPSSSRLQDLVSSELGELAHAALDSMSYAIFLDGIDELRTDPSSLTAEGGASNPPLVGDINDSARLAGPIGLTHLVVAGRRCESMNLLNLAEFTIVPLTRNNVSELADAYLGEQSAAFIQQINRAGLWDLATTRVEVAALMHLFRLGGAEGLPTGKGDLHSRLFAARFAREERRGTVQASDREPLDRCLSRLAWSMTLDGNFGWTAPDRVDEETEAWLEDHGPQRRRRLRTLNARLGDHLAKSAVMTGVLEIDGARQRFTHRLTQECFAAKEIESSARAGSLPAWEGHVFGDHFGTVFSLVSDESISALAGELVGKAPWTLADRCQSGGLSDDAALAVIQAARKLGGADLGGDVIAVLNDLAARPSKRVRSAFASCLSDPTCPPQVTVIVLRILANAAETVPGELILSLADDRRRASFPRPREFRGDSRISYTTIGIEALRVALQRIVERDDTQQVARAVFDQGDLFMNEYRLSPDSSETEYVRYGNIIALEVMRSNPPPVMRQDLYEWLVGQSVSDQIAARTEFDGYGTVAVRDMPQSEWASASLQRLLQLWPEVAEHS